MLLGEAGGGLTGGGMVEDNLVTLPVHVLRPVFSVKM